MANRKSTNKYYFSVEGETEQWYLKWLQDVINDTEESAYKVSFDCPVQKNPYKRAKTFIILKTENKKVDIYHFSDYESDEPIHLQQFAKTMDNMKKANEAGKFISYKFGYSNLTFDLWIILHKADYNGSVSHRKNYITHSAELKTLPHIIHFLISFISFPCYIGGNLSSFEAFASFVCFLLSALWV